MIRSPRSLALALSLARWLSALPIDACTEEGEAEVFGSFSIQQRANGLHIVDVLCTWQKAESIAKDANHC